MVRSHFGYPKHFRGRTISLTTEIKETPEARDRDRLAEQLAKLKVESGRDIFEQCFESTGFVCLFVSWFASKLDRCCCCCYGTKG